MPHRHTSMCAKVLDISRSLNLSLLQESTFSNSTAIEGRKKSAQLLSIVTPVRPPPRERKKKLGVLHSVAGAVVASVRWKNKSRDGNNALAGGAPKTANEMYALFEKELEVGERKIASGVLYIVVFSESFFVQVTLIQVSSAWRMQWRSVGSQRNS